MVFVMVIILSKLMTKLALGVIMMMPIFWPDTSGLLLFDWNLDFDIVTFLLVLLGAILFWHLVAFWHLVL